MPWGIFLRGFSPEELVTRPEQVISHFRSHGDNPTRLCRLCHVWDFPEAPEAHAEIHRRELEHYLNARKRQTEHDRHAAVEQRRAERAARDQEIAALVESGKLTPEEIAEDFGLSVKTVKNIAAKLRNLEGAA